MYILAIMLSDVELYVTAAIYLMFLSKEIYIESVDESVTSEAGATLA